MSQKFSAVAFDLDGTLYPNYRFNIKLAPFLLRHGRLLAAFGKARNIIRDEQKQNPSASLPDFYEYQARLTAQLLKGKNKAPPNEVQEKINSLMYRGWEPLFTTIKLFPHVPEVLAELRAAGLKLGLLSDFPPREKLKNLRLEGFWDTILCSEETGALKPAKKPFIELANALECPPEQILYVGNSRHYDVMGAAQAGMKTAWVLNRSKLRRPNADFIFHDYRKLRDYVLH